MRPCRRASARRMAMRLAAATSIARHKILRGRGTLAWLLLGAVVALGAPLAVAGKSAPAGRAVMAWHVTIAPSWFDPSTAPPQITPLIPTNIRDAAEADISPKDTDSRFDRSAGTVSLVIVVARAERCALKWGLQWVAAANRYAPGQPNRITIFVY